MIKRNFLISTAIISVLTFFIYNGLSISFSNKTRLDKIKSIYFPTLEKIDSAIIKINDIENLLLQFVTTGDETLLDNAKLQRDEVNALFSQIDQTYKKNTDKLIDEFNLYINLGIRASSSLHQHQFKPKTKQNFRNIHANILEMNLKLKTLRGIANSFRKRIYDDFTLTLHTANKEAKNNFDSEIIKAFIILTSILVMMYFTIRYFYLVRYIKKNNDISEICI